MGMGLGFRDVGDLRCEKTGGWDCYREDYEIPTVGTGEMHKHKSLAPVQVNVFVSYNT